LDRTQSRDTDRDIRLAAAPGPAARVGDDDANGCAAPEVDLLPHVFRGCVGIERQQRRDAPGNVRAVDARVGAHEAMPRFADQNPAVEANHAARLANNNLNHAGILVPGRCPLVCQAGRLDVIKNDEATLGFGDDFLCDHQDIAIGNGRPLTVSGLEDQRCQIITRPNFADAIHGPHIDAASHGYNRKESTVRGMVAAPSDDACPRTAMRARARR
jgi:hypothetical protein